MSYANRSSIKILIRHPEETKSDFLYNFVNDYLNQAEAYEIDKSIGYSKPSMTCYDIYYKNIGLIPNYGGHVPGAKFNFGKTFGNFTIDVKSYMHLPK
ncbi:UPF0605 protein CG18335 [Condylostylus longicornis]|uniref:UPF0605 protein CG18335 n=1 Tax=Condylostylus longicornis TaxID=2530218 RepID=UPI00244E37DE|nr:UPF0605 protein CG18335 [Condylostylus longicornis]